MKFIHCADVHIGAWREKALCELPLLAFERVIDAAIQQQVDFVILAGDLFNSSIPPLDLLKKTTTVLMRLKEKGIPLYLVPGSHDYSPSGKSMLAVLEEANLVKSVFLGSVENKILKMGFVEDKKTGIKLTGIPGLRAMLDQKWYEQLDKKTLEDEPGEKIFIFHTALKEILPAQLLMIESTSLALLPKHFKYYAGGHIHTRQHIKEKDYPLIVFPGPVFPASISELIDLGVGGYMLFNGEEAQFQPIVVATRKLFEIDCTSKNIELIVQEAFSYSQESCLHAIIIISLKGILGIKRCDVDLRTMAKPFYDKGALHVFILTKDVEEQQEILMDEKRVLSSFEEELSSHLDLEKQEGETVASFEKRVLESGLSFLFKDEQSF